MRFLILILLAARVAAGQQVFPSGSASVTAGTGITVIGGVVALDTAVALTKATAQSGVVLYCASASASSTVYTCALSPTLGAYTTGMVVQWKPDVNGSGGATTLNIDAVGAKSIKLSDGSTDPAPADIVAGKLYALWYDGTVLRLPRIKIKHTVNLQPSTSTAGGSGSHSAWSSYSGGATFSGASSDTDIGMRMSMTSTQSAIAHVKLPTNWDGGTISLSARFAIGSGGSNNQIVTLQGTTACAGADGTLHSISYNTAATNQVTLTTATANYIYSGTIALPTTGCAAGSVMRVKLARNGTGETFAGTIYPFMTDISYYATIE